MFKTVSTHVPPPPGMPPPVLWGVAENVRERFGEGISKLEAKPQNITFAFPFAPAEVVEHFRIYFGPAHKAFNALDENGAAALRKDLEELWTAHNTANDGTTSIEAEYLDVFAVRA